MCRHNGAVVVDLFHYRHALIFGQSNARCGLFIDAVPPGVDKHGPIAVSQFLAHVSDEGRTFDPKTSVYPDRKIGSWAVRKWRVADGETPAWKNLVAEELEALGPHPRRDVAVCRDVNHTPGSHTPRHPRIGEANELAGFVLRCRLFERIKPAEHSSVNYRNHCILGSVCNRAHTSQPPLIV